MSSTTSRIGALSLAGIVTLTGALAAPATASVVQAGPTHRVVCRAPHDGVTTRVSLSLPRAITGHDGAGKECSFVGPYLKRVAIVDIDPKHTLRWLSHRPTGNDVTRFHYTHRARGLRGGRGERLSYLLHDGSTTWHVVIVQDRDVRVWWSTTQRGWSRNLHAFHHLLRTARITTRR